MERKPIISLPYNSSPVHWFMRLSGCAGRGCKVRHEYYADSPIHVFVHGVGEAAFETDDDFDIREFSAVSDLTHKVLHWIDGVHEYEDRRKEASNGICPACLPKLPRPAAEMAAG